jgi:uncharacterized membrane protein
VSQSGVVTTHDPAEAEMARTIYILFVVGWLIPIIAPIVGVIMAYMNREDAPAWVQTHYQMQIRTFWIGLLYLVISLVISAVTSLIFIGWLLALLTLIWWIARCVKGLQAIFAGAPYENPTTWLW